MFDIRLSDLENLSSFVPILEVEMKTVKAMI